MLLDSALMIKQAIRTRAVIANRERHRFVGVIKTARSWSRTAHKQVGTRQDATVDTCPLHFTGVTFPPWLSWLRDELMNQDCTVRRFSDPVPTCWIRMDTRTYYEQ